MELGYDPKLRLAAKEMKAIAEKYNIGAMIGLASETHTEFELLLEPKWSLIRFIRNGDAVHIKFHHSKQPQLDQTASMVFSFKDLAALFFSQLDNITEKFKQHAKVIHKPLKVADINNADREE